MRTADRIAGQGALTLLALVAWAGVALQCGLSIQLAIANGKTVLDGLVAFSGYFTVLTNVLVAVMASAPLVATGSRLGQWFGRPGMRGCVTTAILTVGIGYHLLLRTIWSPEGLQWVADVVLHSVVPIGALAYWVAHPPRARLPASAPLAWAVYPAAYMGYALLRGELLGTYPYPFIDVTSLGYAHAALNALGLLIAFVALGYVIRAVAHWRRHAGSDTD